MEKLTRRQLAVAGTAALAAAAIAQTPPDTELDKARESHRQNSAVLAAFPVAMSVEPAFQFKA